MAHNFFHDFDVKEWRSISREEILAEKLQEAKS